MRTRSWIMFPALLAAIGAASTPGLAAEEEQPPPVSPTEIRITSPYAGVAVEPGDSTTFEITVSAPFGERVAVTVATVPEGWEAELSGGGFVVDEVIVTGDGPPELSLNVTVPEGAEPGTHTVTLQAAAAGQTDRLDIDVRVAEAIRGEVRMFTEFPALRGASDDTFSYTVSLENGTPNEIQFGLEAAGPDGWLLEARPTGESQASTISLAAGETTTITLDADPPDDTPAGTYPLAMRATGAGETATIELAAEVTGNFAMQLTTVDERLNLDITSGGTGEIDLVVVNSGTAPLGELSLDATPPSGWDVTFEPENVAAVAPGETLAVKAVVSAAQEAVAGDYVVSLTARTAETTEAMDIRVTVRTSPLWGFIGIGLIALAVAALMLVFRRYGRR